jgi:hypothetical protein
MTDYEKLDAEMEERRKYANGMNDRIRSDGVESIGLDERDWIILRLLYQLYIEGRQSNNPESRRIIGWFCDTHPGYGQEVMMAAFSRLAGEARTRNEKMYEPYWKEKGTWQ